MKSYVETVDPSDYAAIDKLIKESYASGDVNTDGDEADMVKRLREYSGYRDEYELVVKDSKGDLVGHALMIPVTVKGPKVKYSILSIVELSVEKNSRGKGYAQMLVSELQARASLAGYPAIDVLDGSDFFADRGYVSSQNFDIYSTLPVKMENNLIKPLQNGSLFGKGGKIYYPEEFFGTQRSVI